jgi:hypothetical protein
MPFLVGTFPCPSFSCGGLQQLLKLMAVTTEVSTGGPCVSLYLPLSEPFIYHSFPSLHSQLRWIIWSRWELMRKMKGIVPILRWCNEVSDENI